MNASNTKPFLVAWAICIIITAFAFATYGWPANAYTWVWFAIALALCSLVKFHGYRCFPFPLVFFVPIILPYQSNYIMDVRSGRGGIELYPVFFKFGCETQNTRLVKKHLGNFEPDWQYSNTRSIDFFNFGNWRDGNDRMHSRSILFRSCLPVVLEKLTDDAARKQALRCITDKDNLLKFHQEILLTMLMDRGYPKGHDSRSWWAKHGQLFEPETDHDRARETAGGWTKHLRRTPTEYSDIVQYLIDTAERRTGFIDGEAGVDNVDWWEPKVDNFGE